MNDPTVTIFNENVRDPEELITVRVLPMNLTDLELRDCIKEEAAELLIAISKVGRFGAYNHHPDRKGNNNLYETLDEWRQLYYLMSEFIGRAGGTIEELDYEPQGRLVMRPRKEAFT